MIDDEVRGVLQTLVEDTGAVSARIVDSDDTRTGVPSRTLALGGGEFLRVELPTRSSREHDVEAAFERATRQLRAIRRRWEVSRLPAVVVATGAAARPVGEKVIERITGYLVALAEIASPGSAGARSNSPTGELRRSTERASNALVTRGSQLVAAARAPDDAEDSRWQFLARRALATHAPGSSHGEVVDPDAFAMTFYYDAALVVLLAEPYAVDFVRHRCRQVARELAVLLPLLDPEPAAPAAMRRRPPTLT